MTKKISRRIFVKLLVFCTFFTTSISKSFASVSTSSKKSAPEHPNKKLNNLLNLGVDSDGISRVYISKGESPEDNIRQAIKLFGGIHKIVKEDDIVIIKPNAQWWHQGTSNTNNLKGLIEIILKIPNFKGEIIIAENHHYIETNSRGWNTQQRNGDYNLNELVNYFNSQSIDNVSKVHWVDAGPNPRPREGNAGTGNTAIYDPLKTQLENGYVWLKDKCYVSDEGRKCMMTYPLFTSPYSGKKIDLMNGVIEDGHFTDSVKLINFSCLNHHGKDWGVTASIKNLMGIVDMTCGYQGIDPPGYYNTHFIGSESKLFNYYGGKFSYWGRKYGFGQTIGKTMLKFGTFQNHFTGGALGYWMRHVKMPDLHILAAEYVGWGGRTDATKRSQVKTVALSTDPVALDYVGAKTILLAETPLDEKELRQLNNPDKPPFKLFLNECRKQGVGSTNYNKIKTIT